jgi:5'-nucleotidase (lipoprotein e(P4) family)
MYALAALILLPMTAEAGDKSTRWVRDSIEYHTLTHQVYAGATRAVRATVADERLKKKDHWVVVVDVDETILDNSPYQLQMGAYGTSFEPVSWNAWCERREAIPVPGAAAFIAAVHEAGGKVAFVTNRHEVTRAATRANLESQGLWGGDDILCLKTDDDAYDKVVRRTEVRTGTGPCSWEGKPARVLAYVGDTITDFPESGEEEGVDRGSAWGQTYFLLPNPMYGSWEREVTRPAPN